MCKVPFILVALIVITIDKSFSVTCPDRFQPFGSKCIYIPPHNLSAFLSWNASRESCKSIHTASDLLTIKSAEEQDYVTALVGNLKYAFWIGYQRIDGLFYSVDNSSVTYFNWKKGEPSDTKDMCVFVYTRIHNIGEWNDVRCEKEIGYICEVPPSATPSPDKPGNSSDILLNQGMCDPGFFWYQSICYQVLPNTNRTNWDGTAATCSALRSSAIPAVVHTLADAAFLRVLVHSSNESSHITWIGFKGKPGIYGAAAFQSSDNYTVGYDDLLKPLAFTKPLESEVCLSLNCYISRLQITEPCDSTMPLTTCMYYHENHTTGLPNTTIFCPLGWELYGPNCYRKSGNLKIFEKAQSKCIDANASLISIHSLHQQQYLAENSDLPQWIGLIQNGSNITWVDGTPFDFVHFRAGEPSRINVKNESEECFEMQARKAEWNDVYCNKIRRYTCQKPAQPSDCPPSYSYRVDNACYSVVNENMTFFAAEAYCKLSNASLVSYEASREQLVQLRMSNTLPTEYWVGLITLNSDPSSKEMSVSWLDNLPVDDFLNQRLQLYRGPVDQLQCLFSDTKKLIQAKCSESKNFVCKYYKESPPTLPKNEKNCTDGLKRFGSLCLKVCSNSFPCEDQSKPTKSTAGPSKSSVAITTPTKTVTGITTPSKAPTAIETKSPVAITTTSKNDADNAAHEMTTATSSASSKTIAGLVIGLLGLCFFVAVAIFLWRGARFNGLLGTGPLRGGTATGGGTSFHNPVYSPISEGFA